MTVLLRLFIWALPMSVLANCKLGLQQDLESRRSHYKFLIPESARFERIADGSAAQFQFKTTEPVRCEIFYYAQDAGQLPAKESPERMNCSNTNPTSEFNETILTLSEEVLYNVGVYVWPASDPNSAGEALVVREKFSGNGSVRRPDGRFDAIMMARFNVPLAAIEVQRVNLSPPVKASEILAKNSPAPGCGPSLTTPSWATRSLAGISGLKAFAFRGYATANATESQNRLIATFDSIQFGNPEWEWTYQTPEQENVLVKMRTPGRFSGVELSNGANAVLSGTDISKGSQSVRLDAQRPLIVRWQWENLPTNANVRVRIGKPGDAGSVYCVFQADAGQGEIDSFRLSGLPRGTQPLTVELESLSFQASKGWFSRSLDWRTIDLEKS